MALLTIDRPRPYHHACRSADVTVCENLIIIGARVPADLYGVGSSSLVSAGRAELAIKGIAGR
jgi:hypothetical protein